MTKIKVCGITNLTDARDALALGVDFLGFILCRGSKRYVAYPTARKIIQELPAFGEKVLVFLNEELDVVVKIARKCGVNFVQLHGQETPEYCQHLRENNLKVIKTMVLHSEDDLKKIASYRANIDYLLIDNSDEQGLGGTGQVADWDLVVRAKDIFPAIFLAGGLTAENVAAAIEKVRPLGVDVASGVERIPGKKDYQKLLSFVQQVRRYG